MNIANQLKNYRNSVSISQEQLAEVVHVSRQTISNWETGKSYPDLQSLLILSEYFKVSLDDLVKGDVLMMKRNANIQRLNRLSFFMLGSFIFMVLSIVLYKYWGPMALMIPLLFYAFMMYAAFSIEKIKKVEDIQTYRQILDYMKKREVQKDFNKKKLVLEKVLFTIGSAVITFFLVYAVLTFL
ncbi:hypothetical protein BEP19_02125 [Ammoniphilus oxalaticus]|uniref:HTH cro/C1-type domain-containing protein n=1 Tax=Ammoniphilus oxalaticus TaxID=66863 RepID=A0A419SNG4_9BACL|nr:helix-turn-helix transcriptional regulator [Ammoniphilus oxalaticus]RKD25761.1 hypothetical protein BEP19_02125 [Ammoniphilus oxalaticus]